MSSQDEAVEALENFISAVVTARGELRKTERFLREVLRLVDEGQMIESLILLKPPSGRRQEYQEALEEVNRRRHVARQKAFALALERGVSISELARAWGISRQLASRYVKEADGAVAAEHYSAEPVPPGDF
jgi:hypothetical protein